MKKIKETLKQRYEKPYEIYIFGMLSGITCFLAVYIIFAEGTPVWLQLITAVLAVPVFSITVNQFKR